MEGSIRRLSTIVRRSAVVLATVGLVAGVAVSAASARPQEDKKITVRLDFLIRGHHSGFFVALEKGWYKEVGLDVSIAEGTGSGATAQLVAAGRETFGFVDATAMVAANAQGAGLRMVANMRARNGAAVVVRKDSAINSAKDLENGPTIAITPPGTFFSNIWPLYLRAAGVDDTKVKVRSMSNFVFLNAFLTKQVDGLIGLIDGEVTQAQLAGVPVRVFPFAERGLDTISHGIVAKASTIESDPEMVRKFVAATQRGWQFMLDNPNQAVGVLQKYYPNINPAQYVARIKGVRKVLFTPNNVGKPLGWMSRKDWGNTTALLVKYGGLKDLPAGIENLYTNEFIPPCKSKVVPKDRNCT